jgi:hypothetical protein
MLSRAEPTRSVGARLRVLTLLLYLTLDCANPMMAGAVGFDPDTCVEAVTHARPLAPTGVASATHVVDPAVLRLACPVRRSSIPVASGGGVDVPPRARAGLALVADASPEDG